MKGFSVELEGLQATLNKLSKKENELTKRIDDVLEYHAEEIAGLARKLAPVGKYTGGGNLRRSIGKAPVRKLTWEIHANAHYAAYMEFGTGGLVDVPKGLEAFAMQYKGKGIKKVNIRPQPFLWPALMANRRQLIEDIKNELNEKPR